MTLMLSEGPCGLNQMGLPSRSQLTKYYAEKSLLDLENIHWYEAFAQWKTATVLQQLHYRWKVGIVRTNGWQLSLMPFPFYSKG